MAPRSSDVHGNGNHHAHQHQHSPTSDNGNHNAESAAVESRASSQAEAVAELVEAASHHGTNVQDTTATASGNQDSTTTTTTTPPSTPPRIPAPQSPVPQESALKRLGQRLRNRARRSLSAPPALRRRRRMRTQLLEEHFCVVHQQLGDGEDSTAQPQTVPVVLPGVPRYEDNWARDLHDFFNLVVLVPVVALNVMNWNWDLLLHSSGNHHHNHHHHHHHNAPKWESLGDAWTGEYYYPFFYVTALYFITDLLWILIEPTCVRSPSVIIQHHIATLLYIFIPYKIPHVRWCMGACMSVEVNTWLLIARRVFNKQGFPPWTIIDLSFFSIRVKLISIFFYITWIGIRCILYPYLLLDIWNLYNDYSTKVAKTYWNWLLVCLPLHAIFCLLNLKWSYDLLMSKIRYWRRRGTYSADDDTEKDKGL